MNKLRNILDDGAASLLLDIVRGHFTDADLGQDVYYRLLDMDVEEPAVDLAMARDIAAWIADGIVLPGFMSSLWTFLVRYSEVAASKAPTPDFRFLEAGTDSHDFFMWLAANQRSKADSYRRWPKPVADRLWRYFKADRLRRYGYTVVVEGSDNDETMRVERCQITTSSD